jgi:hydroxyacylglutathione hydrolase
MLTNIAPPPDFSPLKVTGIAIFEDNYSWLLHNERHGWIVDPGEAKPVIDCLTRLGIDLKGILVTHGHWDHVSGISDLTNLFQVPVYGAKAGHPSISDVVTEGDCVDLDGVTLKIWETPGHTADHISFYCQSQGWLFCGDTLFSGGCGRLKQSGDILDLFHSTQRIGQLPKNTLIYCAHEYTLSNLAFAQAVEPHNSAIKDYLGEIQALRLRHLPSIPSCIATELRCNPFLRLDEEAVIRSVKGYNVEGCVRNGKFGVFSTLRSWKDNF